MPPMLEPKTNRRLCGEGYSTTIFIEHEVLEIQYFKTQINYKNPNFTWKVPPCQLRNLEVHLARNSSFFWSQHWTQLPGRQRAQAGLRTVQVYTKLQTNGNLFVCWHKTEYRNQFKRPYCCLFVGNQNLFGASSRRSLAHFTLWGSAPVQKSNGNIGRKKGQKRFWDSVSQKFWFNLSSN